MLKHYFLLFFTWVTVTAYADCRVLRLVETQTTDNILSNQLAKRLFLDQGWETVTVSADSSKEAYELLSHSQADAYLSTWIPLDKAVFKPYALSGGVRTLGRLMSNTQIGIAGNAGAEQLGIVSLGELKNFGQQINYTIYITQQDWLFAQELQRIINDDIYQLANFRVQRVHTFDLEDILLKAEETNEPVIFFARQLSHIGQQHAQQFLYDTLNILDKYQVQTDIYSSVRYQFPDECPQQASVLKSLDLNDFDISHFFTIANGSKDSLKRVIDLIYDER